MDRSLKQSQASSTWAQWCLTRVASLISDILSRIVHKTAALARLKPVWNDGSISLRSKIQLMCSLITSIVLYACESWILTVQLQRKI